MESLERFQQNRRIIEDFTGRTLAAIPGNFSRLLYLSSLRDLASGRYVHAGLSTVYPEEAVQQALAQCHEELFHKILETPLEEQEWDLRLCLSKLEGDFWEIVDRWRDVDSYRIMIPIGQQPYLQELFCSNVNALLELLVEERPTFQPTA